MEPTPITFQLLDQASEYLMALLDNKCTKEKKEKIRKFAEGLAVLLPLKKFIDKTYQEHLNK